MRSQVYLVVIFALVQLTVPTLAVPPTAEVSYEGVVINHNDFSPSLADGTDWGTIYQGSPFISRTYTITNTGDQVLTLSALASTRVTVNLARWYLISPFPVRNIDPGSNTTFVIGYTPPSSHGQYEANVTINFENDGLGRNPFVFTIQAFHFVRTWDPHVYCLNGTEVFNNAPVTPATDFGTCRLGIEYLMNCTVVNQGNSNITIDPLYVDPEQVLYNFTVQSFPDVIEPYPKEYHFRVSVIVLALQLLAPGLGWNNESPFTLYYQCDGQDAIPSTYFGTSPILPGAQPDEFLGTAFGFASSAVPSDRTFILTNTGNLGGLTSTISFTGPHAADFSALVAPTASVSAGSNVTFTIRFSPTGLGSRSATLNVNSGATGYPSSFSFLVSGTGVSVTPKVTVRNGGTAIANGETGTEATGFGVCRIGAVSTLDFTIVSDATTELTLTSPVLITGAGFSITRQPALSIPALSSDYFTVTWTPTFPGYQSAVITINTNDTTIPVFSFTAFGFGRYLSLQVTGNGNIIPICATGGRMTDLTDWGFVNPSPSNEIRHNFVIENVGSSTVTLTNSPDYVTISGPHATDFTVTTQLSSGLFAPGDKLMFSITFQASGTGLRTANVSIANNDVLQSDFYFAVQGTGQTGPQMAVYGNTSYIQPGARYPNLLDWTDFGLTNPGGGKIRTFYIQTRGSAGFNLLPTAASSTTITGSGDWIISEAPVNQVFGGGLARGHHRR